MKNEEKWHGKLNHFWTFNEFGSRFRMLPVSLVSDFGCNELVSDWVDNILTIALGSPQDDNCKEISAAENVRLTNSQSWNLHGDLALEHIHNPFLSQDPLAYDGVPSNWVHLWKSQRFCRCGWGKLYSEYISVACDHNSAYSTAVFSVDTFTTRWYTNILSLVTTGSAVQEIVWANNRHCEPLLWPW